MCPSVPGWLAHDDCVLMEGKWPGRMGEFCPCVGDAIQLSLINLVRWCLGVDHRIPMHLPPHILISPGLVVTPGAFPSFLGKQEWRGRLEGVLPTSTATLQTPRPTPCMESSARSTCPPGWLANTTFTPLPCQSVLQP